MSDVLKNTYFFHQQADSTVTSADTLTSAPAAVDTSVIDTLKSRKVTTKTDNLTKDTLTKKTVSADTAKISKAVTTPKQEIDTLKQNTTKTDTSVVKPAKPVVKKVPPRKEAINTAKTAVAVKKSKSGTQKAVKTKKELPAQKDTLQKEVKDTTSSKDRGVFLQSTTTLPAPIPREAVSPFKAHNEWLAALLIFSVLLTGLLRVTSIKYLSELFRAAFNQVAANKMYTSINIRYSKPSFILSAMFFFNAGIFVFETLMFYEKTIFDLTGFTLLLLIWGVLIGFGLIKSFLYRLTGFVFDTSAAAGEYIFNSNLLSKVFAIVLLPLISIIPFVNTWLVPNLIKLGAIAFLFLYILQLIRGAAIFLQNRFSLFYMFLYFCALEILPLVILYKILF